MADDTFEYITTDFMVSIDSGTPSVQPVEYVIELGEQGIPGIQGEQGEPGYSPVVNYTWNNDTIQFTLVNRDYTETTPNLYDYVLKKDGSNANNPINLNHLTMGYEYGSPYINSDNNLYIRGEIISLQANNKVTYNNKEIATVNDIGNGTITLTQGGVTKGTFTTNQSGNTTIELDAGGTDGLYTDGSNADANFTVNGVKLAGNYVYIDGVSYGGIHAIQTNPSIYYQLGVDSNRAFLSMPTLTLNSYPAIGSGGMYSPADTIMNVSSNMRISLSGSNKLYYGSSNTVNNEVAIKGDIPTVSDATITINQGGVTKGTFTLNGSATTIDLDAGGSSGAVDSVNGQTGDVVLTASDVGALPDSTIIPTKTSDLTNDSNFATVSQIPTNNNQLTNGAGYITITDVPTKTSDLTNDSGYITLSALNGYATEQWVTNQGYLTSISSSDVVTALGYTPYSASNPNGYTNNIGTVTSVNNTSPDADGNVTLSIPSTTNFVTTNTAQDISGRKTFLGEKAIHFKQSTSTDKLGFTLYNTSNTEVGALEYRPGTILGTPLLALNSSGSTYVGFRYWTSGKPMNYYVPLPKNTTLTSGDYCLTLGIKSNTTNAVAGTDGLIDLTTFIDTSVSSSSTNYKVPSSKLFYDTVGDIETLINAL